MPRKDEAVPAYAGIPLTKRGLSSSVAVVTGARGGDGAPENSVLANLASVDTLVVLMGAAHLRQIDLTAAGRSAQTPAAVIRWGTYEGQQTVTGTLETIAVEAERVGMKAPAVIIVGEVVRLRERLNWFEQSLESLEGEGRLNLGDFYSPLPLGEGPGKRVRSIAPKFDSSVVFTNDDVRIQNQSPLRPPSYEDLSSSHGHDAFLTETDQLASLVRPHLFEQDEIKCFDA